MFTLFYNPTENSIVRSEMLLKRKRNANDLNEWKVEYFDGYVKTWHEINDDNQLKTQKVFWIEFLMKWNEMEGGLGGKGGRGAVV